MDSVSVVKNYYLERIKKLEAENQRLREMLKEAFESLDALLVCFDNNVTPGFLVRIDNFLRKEGAGKGND
jgi:uncharacterized protein (UPF0335 family)